MAEREVIANINFHQWDIKANSFGWFADAHLLKNGEKYHVVNVDTRDWVTFYELREFPGKKFNSVLFE